MFEMAKIWFLVLTLHLPMKSLLFYKLKNWPELDW